MFLPLELPHFFVGKTFQEAMKITYFCTLDISDSLRFDYTTTVEIEEDMPRKSGLLLIGIEYKDPDTSLTQFLINPYKYRIKKEDIGYVVAYDQDHAKTITNLSLKSPHYLNYVKNMNFFKRFKVEETSSPFIEELSKNMNMGFADWQIKKDRYLRKANKKLSEKSTEIPEIYNLNENVSPKGIFRNHIIIKGNIYRLGRIATVIRSYSQRPILLFSETDANPSEWHKIREAFKNVFYVYGNPTNVNHVMQLDPKNAFKILILSGNFNKFIMDSESIIFTRIIGDFFELSNFLTELIDENNVKFLSINPKYPNLDYFFWPLFVRGSIHFSSLAMSIIAKTIINKNWLSFIRNLAVPDHHHEAHDNDDDENEKINTLTLTVAAANEFQMYGHLQYALMCHKPPVIAIAVLKCKTTEKNNNTANVTALLRQNTRKKSTQRNSRLTDNIITSQISKIMSQFYGSEVLMTNPSFLTPLATGDKILIIGNIALINENDNANMMLSSFRFTSRKSYAGQSNRNEKGESGKKNVKKNSEGIKEGIEEAMNQVNGLYKLIINNWDDLQHKNEKGK